MIDVTPEEYEAPLRSCSGCTTDRRLLLIMTQISISITVICFSSYQLVNVKVENNENNIENVYFFLFCALMAHRQKNCPKSFSDYSASSNLDEDLSVFETCFVRNSKRRYPLLDVSM